MAQKIMADARSLQDAGYLSDFGQKSLLLLVI